MGRFHLLSGVLLLSFAAATQASVWSYRSPQGANARSIAQAGNRLLLGTLQGFHVSDDNGASWSRLASLPRWSYGHASVVDPNDAQHWYVRYVEFAPQGDAPFLYLDQVERFRETRDGGLTWQALALPGDALTLPIVHPVASSTLQVWYRDALTGSSTMALSFDGGLNWTPQSRVLNDPGVRLGVALSGRHFVGLRYDNTPEGVDAKLYLSADDLASWSSAVATVRVSYTDVLQLFRRNSTAQQLFWADATTWGLPGRSGTVDLVTGAVATFPETPGLLTRLREDPANPGTVLAQHLGGYSNCNYCLHEDVVSLAPGAGQWQPRGGIRIGAKRSSDDPFFSGLLDAGNGTLWLADSSIGAQRSTDGGATWTAHTAGLREAVINAVAVDPRNADRLLAGRDMQSLQRSDDGGVSWSEVSGQRPQDVRSLARSPVDPDHLVATAADGFYRSRDAGLTWQRVPTAIDTPADTRGWRELVWCANNDTHLLALVGDGVYRSLDGGSTWTASASGTSLRLESARRVPGRVYLLRSNTYAVTADCGVTYTELGGFGGQSRTLAVDPNDDRHLVATGVTIPNEIPSLRISNDGGASWITVMNPGMYSGRNGWVDACDRERYTTYDLRVLRGTVPELIPELPARLSGTARANAVDSQCIGGESVSVVGTSSGLWLRRAAADLLFADAFGID